jgi:hypothetical protein
MKAFRALSEEAIQTAIHNTKHRLVGVAKLLTPRWTGRLAESFQVASTPRSIVFKWSAVDPTASKAGVDYAKIVDKGRPKGAPLKAKNPKGIMAFPRPWHGGPIIYRKGTLTQGAIAPRNFSDAVHKQCLRILMEELEVQLVMKLQGG